MSDGRFGLLGKGVVDALVNVVYLGPLVVSEDVVTAMVLVVSVERVVSIDFLGSVHSVISGNGDIGGARGPRGISGINGANTIVVLV